MDLRGLERHDTSVHVAPACVTEENTFLSQKDVVRASEAALNCLAIRAEFTGKHLPLQRIDGPNLFKLP